MRRKVIKQANQAYTITLPIDWIRKNNLTEKAELDLIVKGKSLMINSDSEVMGGKTQIDLSNLNEREIIMHIDSLYARGIDEIEILSHKDISRTITKALNNIIGFALISQENNKYVVKEVSHGSYSNLEEIFKRVFQMILIFFESAIKDIYEDNKETLESLQLRDNEVNKFCFFLQRAINKMSYEDQINGRILFTYSYALEKISDEIERAWRTNIKNKIKKTQEMRKLAECSLEGLSKAFDLYYRFNSKNINEIYSLREEVRKKTTSLKNLDGNTISFMRHIVKIIEEATDLTHLTLMKNLK